jgi:hypothetical protein
VAAKKSKRSTAVRDATEPGPAERQAIGSAGSRVTSRHRAAQVRVERREGELGLTIGPRHSDVEGYTDRLLDAFGTTSTDFAQRQLMLLVESTGTAGQVPTEEKINSLLAMVDSVRPQNELEAAVAVQLAATHELTMKALSYANASEMRPQFDSYVNAATKLQRTMAAQIEALAKLRRGGEQNVTVKHVHVHEGGQAVVGVVNHGGKGSGAGNGGQPHARTVSNAEVRGENAVRESLPVTGGLREA